MAKAISSSLVDVIRVAPLAPMGGQKINIDHRLSSVYHRHCATRKIGTTTPVSLSLSGNDRSSRQIASQEIATVAWESQLDRSS
jgi:hypothetical protein